MPRTGENIYKRKDGRWEARYIKSYENNKAKYCSLYAKSYKEVKEKLITAKNNVHQQNFEENKKGQEKFEYWLDKWLTISRPRVKESTYIKYMNSIQNHIKPIFKNMNISDINTIILENFIYDKLTTGKLNSNEGLSPKSISEFLIIIKDTVRYAQSEGVNVKCQFDRISIKKKTNEVRVLTTEEEKRLIKTLFKDTDRYKLGVLICMFTGIRIGELCALKWKNISLIDKTLKVNKTLQRLQYPTDNEITKTHIIITEPKSESANRTIPLQDNLIKIIESFYTKPDYYILTGSGKNYVEPRTMQNKFKSYLIESNINNANFHSLRHTFATRCIELGFDVKTLSEILGHSSVKTTLDRYVHSSMEAKRSNMNKLNLLCNIK